LLFTTRKFPIEVIKYHSPNTNQKASTFKDIQKQEPLDNLNLIKTKQNKFKEKGLTIKNMSPKSKTNHCFSNLMSQKPKALKEY